MYNKYGGEEKYHGRKSPFIRGNYLMRFKKNFVLALIGVIILIVCAIVFPFIKAQFILKNFMSFSSYILNYQEATIQNVDYKVSVISEVSLDKATSIKFSSFVYYPNCDQLSYAIYYKSSEYQRKPMYLFDACSPSRYNSEKIYTNTMDYFITKGTRLTKGTPKTFILYESGNEKFGTVTLTWK